MSDKIRTVLWLCVLGVTACILSSCGKSTSTQKVGQHTIVITTTFPYHSGHTTSSVKGVGDQYEWFTHDDGHFKVRLENEVLTVDGAKYLIPHKDDSITIRNGRVKINGKPAKPER